MSFPRWWQSPAAVASAAVMSGVLATAGWAQSPTATERNTTDREDRQEHAGDPARRDQSRNIQSQRVRDEGEQRVAEERQAGQQAAQQRNNQYQSQQGRTQSSQQSRQSQQRSYSRDDGQQRDRNRDYSYDRSSQRDHYDRDQNQHSDRDQQSRNGLTWSQRNDGRLVVDSVESDSAWDRIGLQDGDRVVSINGRRVSSVQDFNRLYASVQAGQRGAIVVYRDGDQETLYWTPRQNSQASHSQSQQHGQAFLGVQLDDRYDDSAVVKAVYRGSPAEQAGLRPGDTIVSLNGQEVGSPHDLTDIVGDMQPGEEVRLQIARRQNVNAQVRLGHCDNDGVRQASFQDRERRDYSYDESSDDDSDRSSRRNNSQKDKSDSRRDNDRSNDDNDNNDESND
jgi:C-terminal processing protease CtpA/Prc